MKYILGVDIGTTALKMAVFDENDQERGSKTLEYTITTTSAGWVEMEVKTYADIFTTSQSGDLPVVYAVLVKSILLLLSTSPTYFGSYVRDSSSGFGKTSLFV